MNAVNLLPPGAGRRPALGLSVSRPFLGLVAVLAVVLGATVLYFSARDTVSSRQAQLRALNAATARWTAAAAAFGPSVEAYGARQRTIGAVRALAVQRYHWSTLLTQIAGRLPADAALSSLVAAAPTSAGGASSASTGASTGATTGTSSNGIAISGCAASQNVVATTMTALRHVTGVSQVTLSSSGKASASTSASGSGCSLPVQFSITLSFASPAATPSAAGSVVGTEAGSTEPPQ